MGRTLSDVEDGEENGVSAPVPHVEERDEAAGGRVRVLNAGSKLVQHVPATYGTNIRQTVHLV
jgi:hypothetical protein